ncbi:hypothetical protein NSK_006066 [Nannochloropsis salina CCMP1776]|jgi:hypothetical protein|uniref:CW-type domain-containing protein n=1 Tax=Nannochloropsis salina CCMP1776 TaxID=1027361 RepID=A0A4D9CTV2_9STRA|nr:hypothetical protein NSK_006066 [Nannochloropsis salina CCMP1776]|eukprot:TFJ82642.1 hypothetical protein NSK_006066 [Nannochloropsis salina CCMP1776]
MAILVDHARIPLPTAESLRRSLGFDPLAHDSVIFFERKGRRLAGNFGAVVRESWSMWNKAAYECFATRDRGAAEAFQDFLEGEVFGWLECEACGRWRMYPREDVLLPREGSVFVCDLAYSWNPAIQGCQTEQEFSIDSVGTGSTNSSTAAPILPAERPAIPKQFEAQIDTAHAETLGGASSVTARRLLVDSKVEGKQWKERGKGGEGLGEAYGRPPKKKAS